MTDRGAHILGERAVCPRSKTVFSEGATHELKSRLNTPEFALSSFGKNVPQHKAKVVQYLYTTIRKN